MHTKYLALAACAGLWMAGSLSAQEFSRFAFGAGAGFTTAVGDTGTRTDLGWNVRAGAGVNFNPYIGVMVNAGYNNLGINSSALANIGVPGGRMSVFSATLDPVIHLTPKRHFDLYVTGGGGLFHRYQEFTAPSVAVTTGFDPFFGFFPVALSANQVLASYSVNKPGIDAGVGVAFGSKFHGKFFAEARYNRIFMGDNFPDTEYIPVTFGFRW
jgi:outer membrane protein with beta-barrel domain